MLTDATLVRSLLALDTNQLPDATITPHLQAAKHQLRRWVGESNYDTSETAIAAAKAELEDGETLEADGDLATQESDLRYAETYLVLMRMVRPLNIVTASSGGIMTSVITDQGQTAMLRPDQVRNEEKALKREASIKAQPYLTTGLSLGRSVAYDDNDDEI